MKGEENTIEISLGINAIFMRTLKLVLEKEETLNI
jgi:hypothetical protein